MPDKLSINDVIRSFPERSLRHQALLAWSEDPEKATLPTIWARVLHDTGETLFREAEAVAGSLDRARAQIEQLDATRRELEVTLGEALQARTRILDLARLIAPNGENKNNNQE